MSKSLMTDGVIATMHFNSGTNAYHAARKVSSVVECCFCHAPLGWMYPTEPGGVVRGRCQVCGNRAEYRTLIIPREVAEYFDVRGGTLYGSPLAVGGVMHIVLPESHPEYDDLMYRLVNRLPITVWQPQNSYGFFDFLNRTLTFVESECMPDAERARLAQHWTDPVFGLLEALHFYGRLFSCRRALYESRVEARIEREAKASAPKLRRALSERLTGQTKWEERAVFTRHMLNMSIPILQPEWTKVTSDWQITMGQADGLPYSSSAEAEVGGNWRGREFCANPRCRLVLAEWEGFEDESAFDQYSYWLLKVTERIRFYDPWGRPLNQVPASDPVQALGVGVLCWFEDGYVGYNCVPGTNITQTTFCSDACAREYLAASRTWGLCMRPQPDGSLMFVADAPERFRTSQVKVSW